jgi:quercetin dioxygenase-like cupin family protein
MEESMSHELIVAKPAELEWENGEADLALPGAEIKILHHDVEDDRIDFLVRFPPGYHEPFHTHLGYHLGMIVEGTMVVNGGEHVLGPGDYVFGPADIPHGPFDFPDGVVVFTSFKGRNRMAHRSLEGDEAATTTT